MLNNEINAFYMNNDKIPPTNPDSLTNITKSKVKTNISSIFLDKKNKTPRLNIPNLKRFEVVDIESGLIDWGKQAFYSDINKVYNCAYDILYYFYGEEIAEEYYHHFSRGMIVTISVDIFVLTKSDIDRWFIDFKFRR